LDYIRWDFGYWIIFVGILGLDYIRWDLGLVELYSLGLGSVELLFNSILDQLDYIRWDLGSVELLFDSI